jgi:hypothetical protein
MYWMEKTPPREGERSGAGKAKKERIAALIGAYHNAISEETRPAGKPNYNRNAPAAERLDASHWTGDQVAEFVKANEDSYNTWARQGEGRPIPMSLEHVADKIAGHFNGRVKPKDEAKTNGTDNPYLKDDYFKRHDQDEEPEHEAPPTLVEFHDKHWLMFLWAAQTNLGPANFDLFVKGKVTLIGVEKTETQDIYTAHVGSESHKRWLVEHFVPMAQRKLAQDINFPVEGRIVTEVPQTQEGASNAVQDNSG